MDERYSNILRSGAVKPSDPASRKPLVDSGGVRIQMKPAMADMNGGKEEKCLRCSLIYERYDESGDSPNKRELVDSIVRLEWEMFQDVQGSEGRAVCQEDPETFRIMRASQAMSWTERTLVSYLEDLREAKRKQRNLIFEKYARMMESTNPKGFREIEEELPDLETGLSELLEQIMEIVLAWEEELTDLYPHVLAKGRPLYSDQDTPWNTSVETYLRGEFSTYSKRTLKHYYADALHKRNNGENGSKTTLLHMVKHYGFSSCEEAERGMVSEQ